MITIILIIIFITNNESFPLINNNNNLGTILTFIGTGIAVDTIIIAVIKWIGRGFISSEEFQAKRKARAEIKRIVGNTSKINYSSLLGGCWGSYKSVFDLRIHCDLLIPQNKNEVSKELKLNGSYIVSGDAGSGKSTLLRDLYGKQTGRFIFKIINRIMSRAIVYYDAIDLLHYEKAKELSSVIKNARYKSFFLICDGLDELGDKETTINEAIECIRILKRSQFNGKMNIIIGSRTTVIRKYHHSKRFSEIFSEEYSVCQWTAESLRILIKKISDCVSNMSSSSIPIESKTDEIIKISSHNPLKCKMICIIYAESHNDSVIIENQFSLYYQFFIKLFEHEFQRYEYFSEYNDACINLFSLVSQLAFEKYSLYYKNCSKTSTVYTEILDGKNKEVISTILNSEGSQFLHYTYEEFFVSYYYVSKLKSFDYTDIREFLSCISQLYDNAYSDFITDGMLLIKDDIISIINYYIFVYSLTTLKSRQMELLNLKEYSIPANVKSLKNIRKNERYIFSLTREQLLLLKYEITFRVGRLKNQYALPFLRYVYYYDNIEDYAKDRYTTYEFAILKRQCAVSASFLCDNTIEMDYVNKMLPGSCSYCIDFDLVNRSHTLIYYGDVINTDLFSYIDDGNATWHFAKEKRISRLKKQPIVYSINDRIACFRLFDLATIYTFVLSRKNNCGITEYDLDVIKNAVVKDILFMPKERELLMEQIKTNIINFMDSFNENANAD